MIQLSSSSKYGIFGTTTTERPKSCSCIVCRTIYTTGSKPWQCSQEVSQMSKDLRIIDLHIPSIMEDMKQQIAKMALSNPEIVKYKRMINDDYTSFTIVSDLINLRNSVIIQYDQFLDLGLEFYRLRKNIYNEVPTTFLELENNNSELRKKFIEIRKTIHNFDYLRFCLNS